MFDLGQRQAIAEILIALISRLLFTPLSWLVPRNPRRIVVIGREGGKFLDNAKYFFCWLEKNRPDDCLPIIVTEHRNVCHDLRNAGVHAYHSPLIGACWALLRAGLIVFDDADAMTHGRLGMMDGARLVQIWHGAPLKEIEMPLHQRRLSRLARPKQVLLDLQTTIIGRFQRTTFLVSTSRYFTEHASGPGLQCRHHHRERVPA